MNKGTSIGAKRYVYIYIWYNSFLRNTISGQLVLEPTINTLRAEGGINCLNYILPITSIVKLQVALFPDWSTAEYITV